MTDENKEVQPEVVPEKPDQKAILAQQYVNACARLGDNLLAKHLLEVSIEELKKEALKIHSVLKVMG